MSQIANALRKVQESRGNYSEPLKGNIVYLTDGPQAALKNSLLVPIAVFTMLAFLTGATAIVLNVQSAGSRQVETLGLEKTIRMQEKRINLMMKESESRKSQLNKLASAETAHYNSLKEAILDDKEQIGYLDRKLRNLTQEIGRISATIDQVKVSTNSVNGT